MGVLPLQFEEGTSWKSLGLTGSETVTIKGTEKGIKPRMKLKLEITNEKGKTQTVPVLCRIDTADEVDYYNNGGILHFVLRNLISA
jgi:aconitate hydratase